MEVFILSNFYPVSLNLKEKLCIVVGGGRVATRRIKKLLESGAVVQVISPALKSELKDLLKANPSSSWINTPYLGKETLKNASLVFAATDNASINEAIYADATALDIFVNVASHGDLSDFIIPSSLNSGDLQVSISTSGKVPGLSKALKKDLKGRLGPEYAILINILERVRSLVINDLTSKDENLTILSEITSNYQSILKAIHSGVGPDEIYETLIHQSGFKN